jgi:23S rRNA (cytosine1962-C5)-methyltransferase
MSVVNLMLKPGFAKPLWAGNPFVYPRALVMPAREPELGECVTVMDADKTPIGFGVYNPNSLYRVRILGWASENLNSLDAIIRHRLNQAKTLREAFINPAHTTAYRLLNSEGDGLSGVTIDMYDNVAVIAVSGAWAVVHLDTLKAACQAVFPGVTFIIRFQSKPLSQEGVTALPKLDNPAPTIEVIENDVKYAIDFATAQKTGFYCDQRDTRMMVRACAKGRRVLDTFCYTGGFSLNAAMGGATEVLGIDSSEHAIALAQKNAVLNNFTNVTFEENDAMKAIQEHKGYDFIILDPPKLAPSRQHVEKAKSHYLKLNREAIAHLPTDGFLLTCSCSSAMDLTLFKRLLLEAAMGAKRQVQIVTTGGGGPDHPVNPAYLESEYLKWVLLRVL